MPDEFPDGFFQKIMEIYKNRESWRLENLENLEKIIKIKENDKILNFILIFMSGVGPGSTFSESKLSYI